MLLGRGDCISVLVLLFLKSKENCDVFQGTGRSGVLRSLESELEEAQPSEDSEA